MKKLKRLMTAAAAALMILPSHICGTRIKAEDTYTLAGGNFAYSDKYGFTSVKSNARGYAQKTDKSPIKWEIEGTTGYCLNLLEDTTAGNKYAKKTSIEEKFGAEDAYLISGYAYYGYNEVPAGSENLYFIAAQYLIWDITNGAEGTGYKLHNTGEADKTALNEVKDAIKKKVEKARNSHNFTGMVYEAARRHTQPILAAVSKTDIIVDTTVKFQKFLIMDEDADMPDVTFKFEITGADIESSVVNGLNLYSVKNSGNVTGDPSIGDVTFSKAGKEFLYESKDSGVTLGESEKYAKAEVTIDFSNVTFKEPGLYRYIVTEQECTVPGMERDENAERILDVYVERNGRCFISSYNFYVTDSTGAVSKLPSFTNRYKTHEIELSKKIAGNQASYNDYFKFNITFSNAIASTVYKFDLADAAGKVNGQENPDSVTIGQDGTASTSVWLKDRQSVKIRGITDSVNYLIEEDKSICDGKSYTPSAALNGSDVALSDKYGVSGKLTDNTDIVFTNSREGTVPTGLRVSMWPVILMVIAAGLMIVLRKRKSA